MATTPAASTQKNAPDKSTSSDWVIETQTPWPDGKCAQKNLQLASVHNHTLVVEPGVQYKLSPAVNPAKDQNHQLSPASSVRHAKKGLDLQLMLPGGGSLVLIDFYAVNAKAAPTKLQLTQLDGKEESVISTLAKDASAAWSVAAPSPGPALRFPAATASSSK